MFRLKSAPQTNRHVLLGFLYQTPVNKSKIFNVWPDVTQILLTGVYLYHCKLETMKETESADKAVLN